MENLSLVLGAVVLSVLIALAILSMIVVDYFRITNGTGGGELAAIWGVAAGGSLVGSIIMGILGVIIALVAYPNTNEYGAAFVGAVFGAFISVPIGLFGGSAAGTVIMYLLLRLNGWRPALIAGAGAFVIGALVSGVSLVPIGFFFFALGHI